MQVLINGQSYELASDATVRTALDALGVAEAGVAAAVDDEVIPRTGWEQHVLHEGARLIVLQPTQGG